MDQREPGDIASSRGAARVRCPGLLRDLGRSRGSCSLGRSCHALELVDDYNAYRSAHEKFSATLPFIEGDDLFEARQPEPSGEGADADRSVKRGLDWLAETLERLDRKGAPTE